MFIDGSSDIEFWCLNLRIEGTEFVNDIELENRDFETQVERHEEESKFEEGVVKRSSMNENVDS